MVIDEIIVDLPEKRAKGLLRMAIEEIAGRMACETCVARIVCGEEPTEDGCMCRTLSFLEAKRVKHYAEEHAEEHKEVKEKEEAELEEEAEPKKKRGRPRRSDT